MVQSYHEMTIEKNQGETVDILVFKHLFELCSNLLNQSAKGTEMTDSMKTWQKSDFL